MQLQLLVFELLLLFDVELLQHQFQHVELRMTRGTTGNGPATAPRSRPTTD